MYAYTSAPTLDETVNPSLRPRKRANGQAPRTLVFGSRKRLRGYKAHFRGPSIEEVEALAQRVRHMPYGGWFLMGSAHKAALSISVLFPT